MQVTLRRAAQARNSISKALEALTVLPHTSVPPTFSPEQAKTARSNALAEATGKLTLIQELEEILYEVRKAIGDANAKSGINALLTRRAIYDRRHKRLASLGGTSIYESDRVQARLDVARQSLTGTYRHSIADEVTIELFEKPQALDYAAQASKLRREIVKIDDQVAELNYSTPVIVNDESWKTLEVRGII